MTSWTEYVQYTGQEVIVGDNNRTQRGKGLITAPDVTCTPDFPERYFVPGSLIMNWLPLTSTQTAKAAAVHGQMLDGITTSPPRSLIHS